MESFTATVNNQDIGISRLLPCPFLRSCTLLSPYSAFFRNLTLSFCFFFDFCIPLPLPLGRYMQHTLNLQFSFMFSLLLEKSQRENECVPNVLLHQRRSSVYVRVCTYCTRLCFQLGIIGFLFFLPKPNQISSFQMLLQQAQTVDVPFGEKVQTRQSVKLAQSDGRIQPKAESSLKPI